MAQREDYAGFGFPSDCMGLVFAANKLFLSDGEAGRVIRFDENLVPDLQIGRPGTGPGELTWAGHLTVVQDQLLVDNSAVRSISRFDLNGVFLDSIPLPEVPIYSRFTSLDDQFYISSPAAEQPISAMGADGNLLFRMGESGFKNDTDRKARSGKHLSIIQMNDQPYLLAIGHTEPLIELYQLTGELIWSQNLKNQPELQERLANADIFYRDSSNRKSSYTLFYDVATEGQEFLAFVSSLKPPYRILRFRVEKDKARHLETWTLKEQLYINYIAWGGGDDLYLFDGESRQIRKYKVERPH